MWFLRGVIGILTASYTKVMNVNIKCRILFSDGLFQFESFSNRLSIRPFLLLSYIRIFRNASVNNIVSNRAKNPGNRKSMRLPGKLLLFQLNKFCSVSNISVKFFSVFYKLFTAII